jgi:type I site-specific restriction endonuclease
MLKYPPFPVRLKKRSNGMYIFDTHRKKWLVLTPEEWVRQHVLNYLVIEKKVPRSIISVEKEVQLNDLKKRYDIVVYDRDMKPWLIVECKAPYIALTSEVVDQALRYNMVVNAPFLMITNGVSDLVFDNSEQAVTLPRFADQKELD